MKTSELSGARLDFWVAKAEGLDPEPWHDPIGNEFRWRGHSVRGGSASDTTHKFSADWFHGGPIIEREHISVFFADSVWFAEDVQTPLSDRVIHRASTPLVVAMRAYVASKYGDEVEERSTGR